MELNTRKKLELDDHLGTAVTNFMANIQWRFLNPNGPRIEKVTKDEPLMNEYVITYLSTCKNCHFYVAAVTHILIVTWQCVLFAILVDQPNIWYIS